MSAPLRLLIDACLTPQAAPALAARFPGLVEAVHLDAIAPPGLPDEDVFALARREGRAVVTANSRDFLALVRRLPGHCGLVLVDDQNTRDRQIAAIAQIVAAILAEGTAVGGRVFTWRAKTGRLASRVMP